jgi:AcrR family transcriptional regulator
MDVTTEAPKAVGRPLVVNSDDIVRAAWGLFEVNGVQGTTMDAVAQAAHISRRSLFNYFPSKEALLFPRIGEYLDGLHSKIVARPATENFLESLEFSMGQMRDFDAQLLCDFPLGPAVVAGRLEPGAVQFIRAQATACLADAALTRFADQPGAHIKAGLVAAIAAQVWSEASDLMRTGESSDVRDAMDQVMGHLRQLVV